MKGSDAGPGPAFWAFAVLVVAFLCLPLLVVLPISLLDSRFIQFPPERLSLRWYRAYAENPDWIAATIRSFQVGIGTTVLSVAIGTAAAVGVTRGRFPGKALVYALIVSPLIVPHVIVALGLFVVYVQFRLIDSLPALVIGHTVLAVPYVVLIVSAPLQQFDQTIERAARVLGASPWRAFRAVTLPAIAPAVFAGGVFAFFVSFDELVVTLFVSGGSPTLPLKIWGDLEVALDPTIAAVAVLMIAITIVGMSAAEALRRSAKRRE